MSRHAPRLRPLAALAVALALAPACVTRPHKAAAGRPLACPDRPLYGSTAPGVLSPDVPRCSYDDALGSSVIQVSGKILLEQEVGPGIGLADVQVRVVRTDLAKAEPAETRSDAQGGYRISGIFPPGEYAITVHDDQGNLLAHRRFEVTPQQIGKLEDMQVWIPIDPRLRGALPPPEPGLPPEPAPSPE